MIEGIQDVLQDSIDHLTQLHNIQSLFLDLLVQYNPS